MVKLIKIQDLEISLVCVSGTEFFEPDSPHSYNYVSASIWILEALLTLLSVSECLIPSFFLYY